MLLVEVPSKVDDGDLRRTSDIDCIVAIATVHDGIIVVASVIIEHVRDADKGVFDNGIKKSDNR